MEPETCQQQTNAAKGVQKGAKGLSKTFTAEQDRTNEEKESTRIAKHDRFLINFDKHIQSKIRQQFNRGKKENMSKWYQQ